MSNVRALSRREALVVAELARSPGQPVTIWQLADAADWPAELWDSGSNDRRIPKVCDRTYAVLQRVKRKFGADSIVHVRQRGYALGPHALDGGEA